MTDKQPNITVTWPTKHGTRKTTINLPYNFSEIYRPPALEDINLKFYDRSNSSYQKQVYLNGKYLGTTIAPSKDHEVNIFKIVCLFIGLGYDYDNLKAVFKSIFKATD
jgi:hypothetical protein